MSDTNGNPADPPTPGPDNPPPPPPRPQPEGDGGTSRDTADEARFTQDDLNARDAKARNAAAAAERRKLAERFGMSLDEVEALITQQREADEAAKSEAQRATEAAQAAQAAAEAETEKARRASLEAALIKRLSLPGGTEDEPLPPCRSDRLEEAIALALPIALDAAEDEDDPIGSAVAHVRSRVSEWFMSPGDNTPPANQAPPPPPARPNGQRNTRPATADPGEMMRQHLEAQRSRQMPPIRTPGGGGDS